MRLSATLGLLAASSLLVFGASPANPAAAAPRNQPAPIVIADHISASALAVRSASAGSAEVLYLTCSEAPNQIYEIPVPAGPVPLPTPLTLIAGNGQLGSLGDGGSALAAQFDLNTRSLMLRSGLAASPDGSLFIADTGNATVRRIAGPDRADFGVIRSIAGRWGPPQSIALDAPAGIALDRRGNLYIADSLANQIAVLPAADSDPPSGLRTLAKVTAPATIAVAPDGSAVYAASPQDGAVLEIDTRTGAITPVIAAGPSDENSCAASVGASTSAPHVCPSGLAVDGRGNLFIADANSGQILRRDALSQEISIAASGFAQPGNIAFDSAGNLFLAEDGRSRVLELRGLGDPASNLSLSPSSAAFPNPPVGSASPAIQFTLSNGSFSPQTVTFTFAGADPADFAVTANQCPSPVPANSSCTLSVAFAPQAPGPRTAALNATDPNGDSVSSSLTGGSSAISFLPATASFGNQPTGSVGGSQMLTLTNNSSAEITGLSLSIVSNANPQVNDFQIQSTNCTTVLAPNASCRVNLTFSPAATGLRSATIVATDSAPQDSAMTALSGAGDDYELQLASNQPQQVSVQQGKTITINFQVVPDSTFSGTVSLACPPTAPVGSSSSTEIPAYASCAINPTSVSVSPGAPVPFSVSINTAANTAFVPPVSPHVDQQPAAIPSAALDVALLWPGRRHLAIPAVSALLAICLWAFLLLPFPKAQKRAVVIPSRVARLRFGAKRRANRARNLQFGLAPRKLSSLLGSPIAIMLSIGAIAFALAGCHHSTPPPSNATPTGTYTLTFQGAAQNATRGVTITLVVTTQ